MTETAMTASSTVTISLNMSLAWAVIIKRVLYKRYIMMIILELLIMQRVIKFLSYSSNMLVNFGR